MESLEDLHNRAHSRRGHPGKGSCELYQAVNKGLLKAFQKWYLDAAELSGAQVFEAIGLNNPVDKYFTGTLPGGRCRLEVLAEEARMKQLSPLSAFPVATLNFPCREFQYRIAGVSPVNPKTISTLQQRSVRRVPTFQSTPPD